MIENKCICCSEKSSFYLEKKNEHGNFSIFRCKNCKSGFVHPYPDEEQLTNYYENDKYRNTSVNEIIEQENIFPNTTLDAERIIYNFNKFKNSSQNNLLDIGCGYGWFCKIAKEHNFNVTATELNKNCRKISFDLSKIHPLKRLVDDKFSEEFQDHFDFIILSQILEHLKIDNKLLNNINKILIPGGIICVAVPNFGSFLSFLQGKKDMFIIPPEHINFFTLEGLKILFLKNNFEIIKHETVSRYNKSKFKKFLLFRFLLFPFLDLFFSISDKLKKGMFLNIYFKKKH